MGEDTRDRAATLFDALREADKRGELLRDRPESMWCQQYEETFEQWESMGGVPADLSTVECLAQMALTLWRQYKALGKTVDDLLVSDPTPREATASPAVGRCWRPPRPEPGRNHE